MAPDRANANSEPVGHVTAVYGTASASAGDESRPLAKGDPVHLGEHIATGPKSAVEITFLDDTILSQTQNSHVNLDTYIFDPNTGSGEVLLKLTQGAFRMATGVIVETNPDKFKVQSPLATIGIRGTDTGHVVPGIGSGQPENHSCLQYDDHPVVVQSNLGGPPQTLFGAGLGVSASTAGLGGVGVLTGAQMGFFGTMSPGALAGGPPSFSPPPEFATPPLPPEDGGEPEVPLPEGPPDQEGQESPGGQGETGDASDAGDVGDDSGAAPSTSFTPPAGVLGQPAMAGVPNTGIPGENTGGPGVDQETPDGTGESVGPGMTPSAFAAPAEEEPDARPEDDEPPDVIESPELPTEPEFTAAVSSGNEATVLESGDQAVPNAAAIVAEVTDSGDSDSGDSDQGDSGSGDSGSGDSGPDDPDPGGSVTFPLQYGTWSGDTADFSTYDQYGGITANLGGRSPSIKYPGQEVPWVVYDDNPQSSPNETWDNMSPAIENVIGSMRNDDLYGNASDNTLDGGAGNDALNAYGGNDVLRGGSGIDYLYAGSGEDSLFGDDGDDYLYGQGDADFIDGGAGTDWALYSTSPSGMTIDLSAGATVTATGGHAEGDTLTDIENLAGSYSDDTLIGADCVDNTIEGRGGADYLNGMSGQDTLFGGDGDDILNGGGQSDDLHGQAGADVYVADAGTWDNPDTFWDFTLSGDTDIVRFQNFPANTYYSSAGYACPAKPSQPYVYYESGTLYFNSDGSAPDTVNDQVVAAFGGTLPGNLGDVNVDGIPYEAW